MGHPLRGRRGMPMDRQYSRRQLVQSTGALGLGLLAGCGRLPWQAPAPSRLPRLGYLSPGGPDVDDAPLTLNPFQEGLREHGYLENQHLLIEYRWAHGDTERLPALAAELVNLPVDLIVAVGTP